MRFKTALKVFVIPVLLLGLAAMVARPATATAAPPPQTAEASETPLVVDGTHFPALEEINNRLRKDLPTLQSPQLDAAAATPAIGANVKFWSWDFAVNSFHSVTATLKAIGQNVDLYVDISNPLAASTIADIVSTADSAIAREHLAFGTEPNPGIDGNRRATILVLDIRDGHNIGAGPAQVGGYFWYLNEYTQSTIDRWYPGEGLKSNEREMIFVDALAIMPGTRSFYQVLTHEFQHMIQWNYDPDEEGWLNEGTSNLAAQLTGFGLPEYHVQSFLNRPNKTLTSSSADVMVDYGGYGLFALYLWENYGGDAFTRDLEAMTTHGAAAIDAVLARRSYSDRLPQVLSHWAVANYLDDLAVYGYRSINILPRGGDSAAGFARPLAKVAPSVYPNVVSTTVAALGADYLAYSGFGQGELVLTLTAGLNANFTVNIITSTSSSFVTGSNVLREVTLRSGTTTTVRLQGAGTAFNSVLVVPVHVSQTVERGSFACQANMVGRPAATATLTPTPAASPTPTRTATTQPSATPALTETPATTPEPSPSATPVLTETPATTTEPSPSATPVLTETPVPTTEPSPSPTATRTAIPTPSYAKRFDSGGKGLTDSLGLTWAADAPYVPGGAGFVDGVATTMLVPVARTADAELYQTERYGLVAYKFDVPNGNYRVTMSFAENYFTAAGKRLFDVLIDNETVLANFDIYKAAGGSCRLYEPSFTVTAVHGQIVVSFVNRKGSPTIQAISVEAITD